MIAIHTGFGLREETPPTAAGDDRRVVLISGKHALAVHLKGIANHRKQGFLLTFAVDIPGGVENLVAAMFRVGLREHHQLNIGGITFQVREGLHQVIDLIFSQRQAQ